MRSKTEALVKAYYDRFNAGDVAGFIALLTDDVAHDLSQGPRETGREKFRRFLEEMNQCYREQVRDLVVMASEDGSRAAAEFNLDGVYAKASDPSLPPAKGQKYVLRVGAFFEIRDGKIARISNHYNFKDWLKQVSS